MRPPPPLACDGRRRRGQRRQMAGQGLVEFALVLPVFLLLIAVSIDLGRAFYAYVAIENAAKEGAFFGATNPRCDTSGKQGCTDPGNVSWKVNDDLSGLAGSTVTVGCLAGGAPVSVESCKEGNQYRVGVSHPFRLVTPILAAFGGTWTIKATATSLVLNDAFDPNAPSVPIPPPAGCVDVPNVVDMKPTDADAAISGAGLTPNGVGDLTTGTKDKVRSQSPSAGCVASATTVTYHFRPN